MPYEDVEIKRITENSNFVQNGDIFVALNGTHTSGEKYIYNAYKNGCVLVVTENTDGIDGYYIKTPNTRSAYATMCAHLYRDPQSRLHCIGVTGTNGKTTVTYMLKHIFEHYDVPCGVMGSIVNITPLKTVEAALTTLDPPQLYGMLDEMHRDGAKYVFMEASSHALALDKVFPISYDVGILTNITSDHMDFHKNTDNYVSAKCKLFTQSKISVLNADDRHFDAIRRRIKGEYVTYSQIDKKADNYFEIIKRTKENIIFKCNGEKYSVNSPADFNVYNAVGAVTAAQCSGLNIKPDCLNGISFPRGRCETVSPKDSEFTVIIDFSHTPDSLENILKACRRITENRLILVFGCGGDRDRTKRPEMGRIAGRYADRTVITADNSRSESTEAIIKDIISGIDKNCCYEVISDRKQAIITALETARSGDCIILAGKGHEEYEITKDGKRHFSEKEIVSRWFGGRQ